MKTINNEKATQKLTRTVPFTANQCTCSNCNCNCRIRMIKLNTTYASLYNKRIG